MEFDFSSSPVFLNLPEKLSQVYFHKKISEDLLCFQGTNEEGSSVSCCVHAFVSSPEALLWRSCKEMLEYSVKNAASLVRGFYGFDILSLELGASMRVFQGDHFSQLLVNHAKTLSPGESKMIQYTSVYGILKKRIQEDWGKIELSTSVRSFTKPVEQFDLLIKKLIRQCPEPSSRLILQDLSAEPLFKFGQEPQTERLGKLLEKNKDKLPWIYLLHDRQVIELGMQFGVRSHV